MSIDFRLREFFYPVGILRLRHILEQTQWMDSREQEAYRNRLLSQVITHAYENVPYYRRVFDAAGISHRLIRSIQDLDHVPLLTRRLLQNRFDDLIAHNARRFQPVMYRTSGSSGSPVQFYLDRKSNILEFCYYWRHWSWAGYRLGDRVADLGAHYFLSQPRQYDQAFHIQRHTRRLMINSSLISRENITGIAAIFRRFRPLYLKGLASGLYFFALCLQESGISDLQIRAVFSSGELLLPCYRSLIETVFHCKVMDSYGTMERTVAISQCPEGGYHLNTDYGVMELINIEQNTGESYFTGNVVGTSLYNYAMPLIRYEIGDTVEMFTEPQSCVCGRKLPLIRGIRGRNEDKIMTPDGRYITSIFIIPEWIDGLRFVQFVQEKSNTLEVRVIPGEQWNDLSHEKLMMYLRRMTGKEMSICIRCITDKDVIRDRSGKCRVVISRLDHVSGPVLKTTQ